MIELPPNLLRDQFHKRFIPGAVFFCRNYYIWESVPKDKFLLVLNGRDEQGYAYYFLPTSQVERVRSNSIWSAALYVIPGGSIGCFPKETGIIVTDIHKTTAGRLERKFVNPSTDDRIEFREMMPEKIMDEIYVMIRASREISLDSKRAVLPSSFFSVD